MNTKLFVVLTLFVGLTESSKAQLPADPLSQKEREIAISVFVADKNIKSWLGKQPWRMCGTELHVSTVGTRKVMVTAYTPENHRGMRVFVNPKSRMVETIVKLAYEDIPLCPDDVAEAKALALKDPIVIRILRRHGGEGRLETQAMMDRSCPRARCIDLYFRSDTGYISGFLITVDLIDKKVGVELSSPR